MAPAVVFAGVVFGLVLTPAALAHGDEQLPAPTLASLALGWEFDASVWLPAIAAVALWLLGVRRVRGRGGRVAAVRTVAWLAGVGVILVALESGIGVYDTTLFSLHMVQHLLLTMAGPPLLLLAGPVTLLLQAAPPAVRRRWILRVLHSRALRIVANPVVAGVVFALVIWGTHLSPVFEASLENAGIHDAEHAAFFVSALLLWWPVMGRDPSPYRLSPAAGALYLGLQMPQMAFLSVAMLMAPAPLYATYASAARTWGPTPLADQQLAAGIMWVGGSLVFIGAVVVLIGLWMRDEDRRAMREDRRLDAAEAALTASVSASPSASPSAPASASASASSSTAGSPSVASSD
ncbi:MAG TPA: cytochrome c oxidase assembly protein [Candidatus Limnocylindrales bacterium]